MMSIFFVFVLSVNDFITRKLNAIYRHTYAVSGSEFRPIGTV